MNTVRLRSSLIVRENESGEDIEEDGFSSGKRMMNWKVERTKNLWIVERKGKRGSKEDPEEMLEQERKNKKRRIETQEEESENIEKSKEQVEVKSGGKSVEGKGSKSGGSRSQRTRNRVQSNHIRNHFSVLDLKETQQQSEEVPASSREVQEVSGVLEEPQTEVEVTLSKDKDEIENPGEAREAKEAETEEARLVEQQEKAED